MGYFERSTLSITTDVSGDATGYTSVANGRIVGVAYVKDATTPFAATADITVSLETTGTIIQQWTNINASSRIIPTDSGESGLTEFNNPCAQERIKVVVAQGGDTKVGKVIIELEGTFAPTAA